MRNNKWHSHAAKVAAIVAERTKCSGGSVLHRLQGCPARSSHAHRVSVSSWRSLLHHPQRLQRTSIPPNVSYLGSWSAVKLPQHLTGSRRDEETHTQTHTHTNPWGCSFSNLPVVVLLSRTLSPTPIWAAPLQICGFKMGRAADKSLWLQVSSPAARSASSDGGNTSVKNSRAEGWRGVLENKKIIQTYNTFHANIAWGLFSLRNTVSSRVMFECF